MCGTEGNAANRALNQDYGYRKSGTANREAMENGSASAEFTGSKPLGHATGDL